MPPVIKCKVDCPCGWQDVFSSGYSGLIIHCPECGKRHRIPTFGQKSADDEIDMDVMRKLLGDRMPEDETPKVTVNFKPLFLIALAVGVVIALAALLLVRPIIPHAAAIAGGALAWPLGISVAWWGQRRHIKKIS